MKIYGIKTCSSVQKALKFFNQKNITYEFIDFKVTKIDIKQIREWENLSSINLIFNNRGKKYRDLNLKELNLDEESKIEYLAKENMLIKRPIIEYENQLIVGYNEDTYNQIFS